MQISASWLYSFLTTKSTIAHDIFDFIMKCYFTFNFQRNKLSFTPV